MSKKKPTSFHVETPPQVRIPEKRESADAPDDDHLEIKNPILANLFHYGMIGILLFIVFLIFGGLLFGRSGGSIPWLVIGGILGVIGLVRWIKSDDYHDEDTGGF